MHAAQRRKIVLGGVGAAVVVAALGLVVAAATRDDHAATVDAVAPSTTLTSTTFRPATTTSTTAAPATTAEPATTTTTAPPTTTSTTAPPPPPPAVDEARLAAIDVPADACAPDDGDDAHQLQATVLGDLDTDGIGDGIAVFGCTSGMSNRSESGVWALFATRSEPVQLVFGQGLVSRFDPGVEHAAIAGGAVVLDIGAAHTYDPHCCPSMDVRDTYKWDGSTFARTSRVVRDAESSTDDVIAGDTSRADPQVTAALADAVAEHGPLLPGETCDLGPASGYDCAVTLTDGTAATLRWEHRGFFDWQAVGFSLDSP